MKNFINFFLFLAIAPVGAIAQDNSAEEAAVLQAVNRIFDGMRSADSAYIRVAFSKDAQLYTVFTNKEGKPVLHQGSLQKFLEAVGSPHEQVWNEPIWDTEVRIDGNLAQVWTKYAFYAGDQFSHCGVDAFHLFKSPEGWKVFHLTDTRNTKDCNIPDAIQKKFKTGG